MDMIEEIVRNPAKARALLVALQAALQNPGNGRLLFDAADIEGMRRDIEALKAEVRSLKGGSAQ